MTRTPPSLIDEHLMRSLDAYFGTKDGELRNLRLYPKGDAQIQADQDAFERREDRDAVDVDGDIESAELYGIKERGPI